MTDIELSADTELVSAHLEQVRHVTNGWLIGLRSHHTRRTYTRALRNWTGWCAERDVDFTNPTRHEVGAWITWMAEIRRYSADTVHTYSAALSSWLRELSLEALRPALNVMSGINLPRRSDVTTVIPLTDTEVQRLIDAARTLSTPAETAVVMMATMGLRAAEAGNVTGGEVQASPFGPLLHIIGKGGKPALLPIPPIVFTAAERVRWPMWDAYLFTKPNPRRAYERVAAWTDTVAKIAGVEGMHPHRLRHWFVTSALREGVAERHVQDSARHSSFDTTRRYDALRNQVVNHATHVVSKLLT